MTPDDRDLLNKINNKLSFLISELEERKELNLSVTAEDLNELQNEVSILENISNMNQEDIKKVDEEINQIALEALSETQLIDFLLSFDKNKPGDIKIVKENKELIETLFKKYFCFNDEIKKVLEDE